MNHREIQAIVRQLSGFLVEELNKQTGETWTIDTSEKWADHACVHIDGPDRKRITVRRKMREYGQNFERLEISGTYPEGYDKSAVYNLEHHTITVKRDRPVEAIAKEITRRLMPKYLVTLAEVIARMEQHANYQSGQEAGMERLHKSLGGDIHGGELWTRLDDGWAKLRVTHGGEKVELDVHSLPIEMVERMIKAARSE